MTNLKKDAERIRKKLKKQSTIDELNGKFEALVVIQKNMAKAFRETLADVNRDFEDLKKRFGELEAKVEKLEGK